MSRRRCHRAPRVATDLCVGRGSTSASHRRRDLPHAPAPHDPRQHTPQLTTCTITRASADVRMRAGGSCSRGFGTLPVMAARGRGLRECGSNDAAAPAAPLLPAPASSPPNLEWLGRDHVAFSSPPNLSQPYRPVLCDRYSGQVARVRVVVFPRCSVAAVHPTSMRVAMAHPVQRYASLTR